MSDLVEFLRARLDEDERIAKAAAKADEYGGPSFWRSRSIAYAIIYDWEPDHEVIAEHVARHDPAHVLREAAAKRLFIDTYAPPDPHGPGKCPDCDMLYAFAAIHSGHPDYREEWTP